MSMSAWRFGEYINSDPVGFWGVEEWGLVILKCTQVILLLLTHGHTFWVARPGFYTIIQQGDGSKYSVRSKEKSHCHLIHIEESEVFPISLPSLLRLDLAHLISSLPPLGIDDTFSTPMLSSRFDSFLPKLLLILSLISPSQFTEMCEYLLPAFNCLRH